MSIIPNANLNSSFPSQVVPDAEKATYDYGLRVGRAIESEWFRNKSDRASMEISQIDENLIKISRNAIEM